MTATVTSPPPRPSASSASATPACRATLTRHCATASSTAADPGRIERAEHVEVARDPHVEAGVRRRRSGARRGARGGVAVSPRPVAGSDRRRGRLRARELAAQSRPTMSPRSWRMPTRSRSSTGPEPAAAMATRWLERGVVQARGRPQLVVVADGELAGLLARSCRPVSRRGSWRRDEPVERAHDDHDDRTPRSPRSVGHVDAAGQRRTPRNAAPPRRARSRGSPR